MYLHTASTRRIYICKTLSKVTAYMYISELSGLCTFLAYAIFLFSCFSLYANLSRGEFVVYE